MTLMIELNPELEKRLNEQAERAGLTASEYAQRLLDESLPTETPKPTEAQLDPTIALFRKWEAEDATDDPEELERREQEWREFQAAMNRTRDEAGARRIFP